MLRGHAIYELALALFIFVQCTSWRVRSATKTHEVFASVPPFRVSCTDDGQITASRSPRSCSPSFFSQRNTYSTMGDTDDASSASASEGDESSVAVHLGFSVPVESPDEAQAIAHISPIWSDWDGGKIGGKPSWLNPRDVPAGPLRCRACAKRNEIKSGDSGGESKTVADATILRFLCQTYCPADAECGPPNPAAFHRTLYVFACPSAECASDPTPDSVLVLRSQLPQENDFYPRSTKGKEDDFDDWNSNESKTHGVNLCVVCGCKAGGRCPKQNLWFCGKDHQKEYNKYAKDGNVSSKLLPSVYAESELVVEDEPALKKTTDDEEEKLRQEMDKVAMFSSNDEGKGKSKDGNATKYKSEGSDEEELDEDLEQMDLNDMTGAEGTGTSDVATLEFYSRIGRGDGDVKDQCLRYCRWKETDAVDDNTDDEEDAKEGGPLWVSSGDVPSDDDIPSCEYCGAPRKFELQVMPQMLNYLFGDNEQCEKKEKIASEEVRAALLAASNIAEQAKSEGREGELPADFKKRHEEALERVRNALLLGGSGMKSGDDGMDWGVIAVYTCTASCGGGGVGGTKNKYGAYRAEFAWRQKPLGV